MEPRGTARSKKEIPYKKKTGLPQDLAGVILIRILTLLHILLAARTLAIYAS